jgi:uncharacterized cupredoxin-like copper-binding protein
VRTDACSHGDRTIVQNHSVEGNTTPMLEPGGAPLKQPGAHTLNCDVAGHPAAGMQTALNVA